MKDTLITAAKKKHEMKALLVCFILANLFNVYGIISFKTSWTEIYTQWYLVLIVTVLLNVIYWIFRFLFNSLRILLKRPGN